MNHAQTDLRTTSCVLNHLEVPGPRAMSDVFSPLDEIESYLAAFVRSRSMPHNLRAAIEYALLGGGKRLRPLLAWWSAEAVGAPGSAALPAAAAVELIHAFSLVHDDLPALDDDDLRRGRPTLHRHAGEAMAILAGDAMMAAAFGVLADRVRDAALFGRLAAILADATSRMISGQVYDTLAGFPDDMPMAERVRVTHNDKTGALISAACVMGAMCANANPDHAAAIDRYAKAVGLMFQIVDDLIDVEQTTEHTGKRTGKDQEAGKLTYPGVLGIDGSRHEITRLKAQALDACERFGPRGQGLRTLCELMAERTK